MNAKDELALDLARILAPAPKSRLIVHITEDREIDVNVHRLADGILKSGYRKIFDGDCGLSGVKDPDDREAAEAWMRWANLAMNDEIGAIGAMKQMLTELGYRKPAQS